MTSNREKAEEIIDRTSEVIRRVDGDHTLGAGALAEALHAEGLLFSDRDNALWLIFEALATSGQIPAEVDTLLSAVSEGEMTDEEAAERARTGRWIENEEHHHDQ